MYRDTTFYIYQERLKIMPNESNQGKDTKATANKPGRSGGTTAAGMQVSGEEIFLPEDNQPKVTLESDVFGQQSAATGNQSNASISEAGQPKQSAQSNPKPDDKASDVASQVTQQVGQVLGGDLKPVTDALNQAKNVAGAVAGQAYEQVQDKAGSVITEQKQSLADGLGSVAENIRQFGDNLRGDGKQPSQIAATAAKYGETLADQIENLSGYLERGDFRTFASDLQTFARRNPTIFVAGAFGLGLIAARFIKSSPRSIGNNKNSNSSNRQTKNSASSTI